MIIKVAFWENVSGELKAEADEYINLFVNINNVKD